jgi:hypothetical protein
MTVAVGRFRDFATIALVYDSLGSCCYSKSSKMSTSAKKIKLRNKRESTRANKGKQMENTGEENKKGIRVWRAAMREREILGTCIERCRHHQHEAVAGLYIYLLDQLEHRCLTN